MLRGVRSLSTKVLPDTKRGVSELSVFLKAGSRYETVPGASHVLKNFVLKDSGKRSGLRLQREAELLGGKLATSLGREDLVITAKFLREDLPYFAEALAAQLTQPAFKPYQLVEEVIPLTRLEYSKFQSNSAALALDNAHEVAFRSGLGNSLVATPETPVSLENVKELASKAFTSDSVTIAAKNVDSSDLEKFVGDAFILPAGAAPSTPRSSLYGGEVRVKSAGPQSVVLAYPLEKPLPCLEALKYVLSSVPVKWSTGTGLLNAAAYEKNVSVDVNQHIYSDAALFTVSLTGTDPAAVGEIAKLASSSIAAIGSKGLSGDVATRAIAQAKFAQAETVPYFAPLDLSSVSASSIKAAAKVASGGKKVLSVVGKTNILPHVDEL